jgi:HNH endonuclease
VLFAVRFLSAASRHERGRSGEIHLTGLCLLRDHFTDHNVQELIARASGKTKRELQELLAARAPKADVLPTITALPAQPVAPSSPSRAQAPAARLEPLAPTRHRLELTVSDDVRAKLERARDLMSHRIRRNDLETVLDHALDALLAKLEKERVGDGISRSVRREVFERDGEQCTFTDDGGNRCPARADLEVDHIVPRARGGTNDAENLRVVCRAHNKLYAEQAFGRAHVEEQIHRRQRMSEHPASPTADVARRALENLGFRRSDVKRAIKRLLPHGATPPPMPDLLRTAIGLLTT